MGAEAFTVEGGIKDSVRPSIVTDTETGMQYIVVCGYIFGSTASIAITPRIDAKGRHMRFEEDWRSAR